MMQYLDYAHLIRLHIQIMRDVMNETYYGVLNAGLLQSALARPMQAAQYEGASPLRHAAYLFQGLLMNHGFAQGNKRTAYLAMRWFLDANRLGELVASHDEKVELCYSAENDKWTVDRIESWLAAHVKP